MQRRPNTRPPNDLTITGKKCQLHRNDHVAKSLDEGTNLIQLNPDTKSHNWHGDDCGPSNSTGCTSTSPLRVDRYDARTLLDEMSLQQLCGRRNLDIDTGIDARSYKHASRPWEEDGSKEEIEARNYERYGALAEYSSCFLKSVPKDDEAKEADKKPSDVTDVGSEKSEKAGKNEETFQLSEDQLKGMPPDIILPKTVRHNTIIEHTASRIAANNQLEVFLKVKQATNADFSFLNPSDELYGYYAYLKEKHSSNGDDNNASLNDDEDKSGSNTSDNPLSGLLGGYSSSSDDDRSAGCEKSEQKKCATSPIKDRVAAECIGEKEEIDNAHEQDKKRRRLERLRMWKESKLKKDGENDAGAK